MELYQIEELRVEQDAVMTSIRSFVEGPAQTQELHQVEEELFRMLQVLGLELLKEVVARHGTGKEKGRMEGHDGQQVPYHGLKGCQYLSIFGLLEVKRAYFWKEGAAGMYPLDKQLNLPERRYSYLLDQWSQLGVVETSFDKATGGLSELLGLSIWKRGQEEVVREVAAHVQEFYEQLPAPADEGPVLCVQADGKGVRMVPAEQPRRESSSPEPARRGKGEKPGHKREAVVTALFSFEPQTRTPEEVVRALMREEKPKKQTKGETAEKPRLPLNKTVFATLYGKEQGFERLANEMARRDPEGQRPIFMLLDAGTGLRERFWEEMEGRGWEKRVVGVCLDIIHVMEYVWEVGNALHGERGVGRIPWVRKTALALLRGQVGRVIGGWRQILTKRGNSLRAAQRRALEKALGYFENHRELMRYDEWLERGFPIATGVVEGACGSLVKDRMEGSGMHWTKAGAQAVLDLRAVKKNGHWHDFWQYHIRREKERLYGDVAA